MSTRCLAAALTAALALAGECTSQQPTTGTAGRPKTRSTGCVSVGEQKVKSPDLAAGDIYGAALAIDGDVALVASEWDDDNGADSGAVFVYRCNGTSWRQEQKLKPADGQAGDNFGRSVSLHGNVAVVGAHWDDDNGINSGSVYVFRYDGKKWVQEQKLLAADGQADDRFGVSVAIDLDVIGVTAWLEDPVGNNNAGAAYIFRHDGNQWVQEQKLGASDAAQGDHFGRYICVSAGVAIVGAWHEDAGGSNAGAAYIFRHDGIQWFEEQKLVAWDAATDDSFGWACSLLGNVAVVGAYGDDDLGTESGSAYVYRFDGLAWQPDQKLLASNGTDGDRFGYATAMDGNQILVTAPVALQVLGGPGAIYVFRYNGADWVEHRKFVPSDGAAQDAFGFHGDLSGRVALTGSWRDDDAGPNSGSAYFYGLDQL